MAKRILMVVDTQYDFMMPDGALYVPGAETLILPMLELLGNCQRDYGCAFFTLDWHEPARYLVSEESKEFPPHCVAGSVGAMNALPMRDLPIPTFFRKKEVFDVWKSEHYPVEDVRSSDCCGLDNWWAREWMYMFPEKPVVDVIGVAADYCVKYAVDGLLARGFRVKVIEQLTRGIHRQWHGMT